MQSFDFTYVEATSGGFFHLSEHCEKIVNLGIGRVRNDPEDALSQLFLKCKKLQYLHLVKTSISGKCLLSLPAGKMEVIILEGMDIYMEADYFNLSNFFDVKPINYITRSCQLFFRSRSRFSFLVEYLYKILMDTLLIKSLLFIWNPMLLV